jgi:DNA modification methylase
MRFRLCEHCRTNPVQTCATSPPYWSLRDYGVEPLVWDGVAGCDHQWDDTISVNATNHTDKRRWNHTRNGRDEEQPIEKRVAWLRTVVDQGNVCESCGAWRGCLGTTGKVAIELGRRAILIEPKAEYVEMIEKRCQTTIGLPLAI